ncbi:MAG TPA: hypothetical protein VHZ03_33450 [Trebonia sp.]|nr:hypothetical protein [Trebonia sp.]
MELDPEPKVTVLVLSGDTYVVSAEARAVQVLSLDEPFPISFDPALMNELD